jgi:hypothetical protein
MKDKLLFSTKLHYVPMVDCSTSGLYSLQPREPTDPKV